MLMRFKQLTLSLCFIGLSATSWSQTVLVKTEKNIEEYELDNDGCETGICPVR